MIAFGLTFVVMLWWGALTMIDMQRTNHRNALRSDTANLSQVFEQNVIRTLREVDKTLLYLRHAQTSGPGEVDWQALFKQAFASSDMTFQLAVIDARGRLLATDRGPQPPQAIDLSDRDHFRVHAYMPGDTIYISKPVLGRVSKKWSVQITRRLSHADGSFAGVIVASLDPEHFSAFYRNIDLGAGGAVTLVGLDGAVRASGGQRPDALGQRLRSTELIDHIRRESSDTVELRDADTGAARIASLKWVRGYPLAVVVATDIEQPASNLALNRQVYLGFAAGLSMLVIVIMLVIYRRSLRLAEARRELELKSLQHALTLENMAEGIIMVEASGEVGFMNSRLAEILKLPEGFARGRHTFAELVADLERHGEFGSSEDFARAADRHNLIARYERKRPDGTVLEVRSKPLPGGGFVRTITDITSRHRAEERMIRLARHDTLTGLANRASFREQLEEAAHRIDAQSFCVLMIDLDRFKPVNDTYGHAVGDLLLKQVADRLRTSTRHGDVIGRLGGDEFAVIQIGASQGEQATSLAQRICRALCQPFSIDGNTISIGASVGIAIPPEHGTTAEQLLYAADLALYAVKAQSRGTHAVFRDEMHEEQCARRRLEEDMRRALEQGQFALHFQPIAAIDAGDVVAYEALLRWSHPERGNVPPLEFVPIAEEAGLIGPIGAWVLEAACLEMSRRTGTARVAVNLSPVQFRERNLVEIVAAALARSGLEPSRLEVEITESALLADDDLTLKHLDALRALGVHITMDDFGTGYSSLSYLMSYPIQTIKIDRAFVKGLGEDHSRAAIVRTITTLATSLGMSTTAEGVETERQLALLRELGCTEAQGYLISKPLPADEILPPLKASADGAEPRSMLPANEPQPLLLAG